MSTFARFPPRLQEAIVARLGWTSLRLVQDLAGAAILDGMNAVVLAPTAGGKTEASVFPVLAQLMDKPAASVGAIYLAPIKALLNNQEDRLGKYTEMVGLRRFVWHGDAKASEKKRFGKEPAELLMTTPESLEVMLLSSRVPAAKMFSDLRVVIIDEVHALAGTDRGAHLMSVLERVARFTGNDVQRIGLSATVGNPTAILEWLKGSSQRKGVVIDPPKKPAKREVLIDLRPEISELAEEAARRAHGHKSLFFCESRSLTETVAERMRGGGTEVFVHHSSVSLEERRLAEERFHRGSDACITCTSTLELGIDVGDLDYVFQANAPKTVSSFLQRMGRTGRRDGHSTNTTFYCDNAESMLQAIALVELARSHWVEPVSLDTRCWPVLVHQLLALTMQFGGISPERCWDQLSRVPDFRDVSKEEFGLLLRHMRENDFLFEAGGLLSMGERAEKIYGRKNFMELYAVFSSPTLYRVVTAAGRDIGSLEQDFVDGLVEEMSSFLLGGRAWTVEHIHHRDRILRVRPAPRGKKPSWGGFIPQMLSYALCDRIRQVLVARAEIPYLHPTAKAALEEYRDDLGELLAREGRPIRVDGDAARWWTFAGGRINFTLKSALHQVTNWKIVADNFLVRMEGDGVGHESVRAAIDAISKSELWRDEALWQSIARDLPQYRLSKFQQALPLAAQEEMIGRYLLDVRGAAEFLGAGDIEARAVKPIVPDQVMPPENTGPSKAEVAALQDKYAEISRRRNTIEIALREMMKSGLKFAKGKKAAHAALMSIPADRRAELMEFGYEQLWGEMYLRELIMILEKNWAAFQTVFGADKGDVLGWLEEVNHRRVDAHAKTISEEQMAYLRICFERLETKLGIEAPHE